MIDVVVIERVFAYFHVLFHREEYFSGHVQGTQDIFIRRAFYPVSSGYPPL